MKIQLRKRKFKEQENFYYSESYQILSCKYCCEGIKELPNIDFHFKETENTDNPLEDECGYSRDIGVMLENDITTADMYYDTYEYTDEYFYKLEYCPICGEKIEVEVIEEIDVTEDYQRLEKDGEKLRDKIKKTDSISKKKQYESSLKELYKKIENMYCNDTLPDRKTEFDCY